MKKITFLALLVAGNVAFAQTQRLVVTEEFSQASCGPCAQQNPAFNTLLNANAGKTISLKYQTSWPGYDPMNEHNPTQVQTRVGYYSVSGVPECRLDGKLKPTGSAYAGAPANVSQSTIDGRYNTPSPIILSVDHTLSNDLDSASVMVTVKNVSGATLNAMSAGSLKLHVIIAEEEINFPAAPGSNGEKDFYHVMREMITGAAGQAIADSWADQQSQTFTFDVELPSYIYNYGEISIVAFVQDNGDKSILQGAYSSPKALPASALDAGISNISQPLSSLCASSFTPEIEITNYSSSPLTSLEVWYSVNGGTPVMTTWTGNLATSAKTTHYISPVTISGPTTFECNLAKPNGGADYNNMNNTTIPAQLSVVNAVPVNTPSMYDLEATPAFEVPTNLIVESNNPSNIFAVNKSVVNGLNTNLGGFEGSYTSITVDFYSIASGEVSNLITEKVSLSGMTNSKLYFDHAYAQYSSENDRVVVSISDDCGATWNSIFSKSGADLATSTPVGNNQRFWPKANNWKRNAIDISAYDGKDIIVKFACTSDFGNMLFFDNILVNNQELSQVGIEENNLSNASFFPNPASDVLKIDLDLASNTKVDVRIINQLGQVVLSKSFETANIIEINTSDLVSGLYTVNVEANNIVVTEKVTIIK